MNSNNGSDTRNTSNNATVNIDSTTRGDDNNNDSISMDNSNTRRETNNTRGSITSVTTVDTIDDRKSTSTGRHTRSSTTNNTRTNDNANLSISTQIDQIHDRTIKPPRRFNRGTTNSIQHTRSSTEMHGAFSSHSKTMDSNTSNVQDDILNSNTSTSTKDHIMEDTRGRSSHDTWEACNLVPISMEYLKSSLLSGRRPFVDDELKVKRIHEFLKLVCNYAFCECMQDILRHRLKDHELTIPFEILINFIHSQFTFADEFSQITFTCQIADITARLIDLGIDNWTADAIRSTTSGLKIKPLNMHNKLSRHIGLMFPHDDFNYTETNSELVENLKKLAKEVNRHEGIHFDKVKELECTCQAILYQNDWIAKDEDEQIYLNDISSLIEQQQDIYGIDKPRVRSMKMIIKKEDQIFVSYNDPVTKEEKDQVIRRCNNRFYDERSNTTNLTKGCFKCMKDDHFTSDHHSYFR